MLAGLLALHLLLGASEPLTTMQNRPVLSVDVTAPPGINVHELRALVDIRPGFLLDARAVQDAIKRLYAMGRFAQVEVFAEEIEGAVALHFVAQALRRLGEIGIVGNEHVSERDLRAALQQHGGDELDSRTVLNMQKRAVRYLHRLGYNRSQVSFLQTPTYEPGFINYRMQVTESEPTKIESIRIAGQPRLAQTVVLGMLSHAPGDVLNHDLLERDREVLRQAYLDHGFLQVAVDPPRILMRGTLASIRWTIRAGDRIHIGFSGNTVFSEESLRNLWPDANRAYSYQRARIMRQRVVSAYVKQGYPFAEVTVRKLREPERGVLHVMYVIRENQPVQVDGITLRGVHAVEPEVLAEQVRRLLAQELGEKPVFSPLHDHELTDARTSTWHAMRRPAHAIALEKRYVPDVYSDAASQIAALYRDMGYLNATVADPVLTFDGAIFGDLEVAAACRLAAGDTAFLPVCSATVQFKVDEGEQVFVGAIVFQDNDAVAADTLLNKVLEKTANRPLSAPLLAGAPFSPSALEDGRIALLRHYRDQGFLYARVFTSTQPSGRGPWVNVYFKIDEGPQVRIGELLVRGNRHTREGVVRSRISLRSGDVYRLEQALADQRSIASLGVFNSVRVKLVNEEHPAEQRDVVADVVERNRHMVELSPGISSAEGPRLRTTYAFLNLLGTASQFTATLKLNRQVFFGLYGDFAESMQQRYDSYRGIEQLTRALEREIRVGLRSPPIRAFFGDPLLRIDLVDQRLNAARYSFDSQALILGVDMVLPARFKSSIEAQLGFINLECNPIDPLCNQDLDLRHLQSRPLEVGEHWVFKSGPLLVWDQRDNPLNPSRGTFVSARYTYAFGAQLHEGSAAYTPFAFNKYEANLTGYIPIWRAVLALAARVGVIHLLESQVPLDERFFLGGRDTLRGYIESTLIPQDACLVSSANDPLPPGCHGSVIAQALPGGGTNPPLSNGGNTFVLFKTELRLPVRDHLSVAIFADLGNLWLHFSPRNTFNLRLGTGAGLRYATPVGAMAIDLGINPDPRPQYDEPWWQVHFSIGAF